MNDRLILSPPPARDVKLSSGKSIEDSINDLNSLIEQLQKKPSQAYFDKMYPIGSIYCSVKSTDPSELFGGTWQSIGAGRVLQGADDAHAAGETIEAGLPNITGYMNRFYGEMAISGDATSGAFYPSNGDSKTYRVNWESGKRAVSFDASRCSAIYGKSNTVQPPALAVYMWQRTA